MPAVPSFAARRRTPKSMPVSTVRRAASGPYCVVAPTTWTTAVSSNSAVRRSRSPALNALTNASSAPGTGAVAIPAGGVLDQLAAPAMQRGLDPRPPSIASASAISSSEKSNTSLSTTAARSCGDSLHQQRPRRLTGRARGGRLVAGVGAPACRPAARGGRASGRSTDSRRCGTATHAGTAAARSSARA